MSVKIQIRRGVPPTNPIPEGFLDEGELALTTDFNKLYIGTPTPVVLGPASNTNNLEILTEISRQVLQGQIAGKADTLHDHSIVEVLGLEDALIDLENGKSNLEHTHVKADITDFEHTHAVADVTGLQDALDLKFNIADFETHTHTKNQITDFEHTHVKEDITDFDEHTHLKADITDFAHTHVIADVTNLQTSLNAKVNTSAVAQASGVASLDNAGKIPLSQLPSAIFDSLLFKSTFSPFNITSLEFANLLYDAFQLTVGIRSMIGVYFVASSTGTLQQQTTAVQDSSGPSRWTWTFSSSSSTTFNPTSSGTLEPGDWIVIESFTGTGSSGDPFVIKLGVVNNTYEVMLGATSNSSGAPGLVPAPGSFNRLQFLRGDGTWATPPSLLTNIFSETAFASVTRVAGQVYGSYNETTGIITWYFGDVGV
jgi:hypothetical protein